MDYSFVIPSNRPYTSIEPLLLSITKQTHTAIAVIIVRDHASTLSERNEYCSQVEQLFIDTNSKVTIVSIHNDSNFHVGKGASYVRNYGRKLVQTPSMIFVDDDNTFDQDFTEKLTKQRKKHPDTIIVPTQYQGQSSEIRQNVVADGFSFWVCRPRRIQHSTFNIQHGISLIPLTLASSNCLSGPTKVFAQYPFDENIPFIYEDMIMTGQMSTHHIRIMLDTDISIYHHHGVRSKAENLYVNTADKAYYKAKHRIILVHTIGSKWQKVVFWIVGIRGHTARLLLAILLYCPVRNRPGCTSSIIKGSRDGIKTIRIL